MVIPLWPQFHFIDKKFFLFFFEKTLDKRVEICYNIRVVRTTYYTKNIFIGGFHYENGKNPLNANKSVGNN